MKLSNSLTDKERHYIQNLIVSRAGEVRSPYKKLSPNATHELVVEKGFITGAKKIIKRDK